MTEDELRGKFLTKLRLEKNLTQSDLAKMLGYSDKSISKWERGKCFPKDTKTLIKLAEILDVSIDDLLHLEYSDVEGKNTPHLKNKYLNFIFQNRKIFVIIFIIIILLFLGYLIFFVYVPNLHDRKIYDKENIKNINENLDVISSKNKYDNYDKDDSENDLNKADRNRSNIKSNHTKLLDEGFVLNKFIYSKKLNESVFVDYYIISESVKVYIYVNNDELIVLNNSTLYDEIIFEKYYDGNYEMEYIKNDGIKDCNLEKCETYLDYAMYINYIKKLILE